MQTVGFASLGRSTRFRIIKKKRVRPANSFRSKGIGTNENRTDRGGRNRIVRFRVSVQTTTTRSRRSKRRVRVHRCHAIVSISGAGNSSCGAVRRKCVSPHHNPRVGRACFFYYFHSPITYIRARSPAYRRKGFNKHNSREPRRTRATSFFGGQGVCSIYTFGHL